MHSLLTSSLPPQVKSMPGIAFGGEKFVDNVSHHRLSFAHSPMSSFRCRFSFHSPENGNATISCLSAAPAAPAAPSNVEDRVEKRPEKVRRCRRRQSGSPGVIRGAIRARARGRALMIHSRG